MGLGPRAVFCLLPRVEYGDKNFIYIYKAAILTPNIDILLQIL